MNVRSRNDCRDGSTKVFCDEDEQGQKTHGKVKVFQTLVYEQERKRFPRVLTESKPRRSAENDKGRIRHQG